MLAPLHSLHLLLRRGRCSRPHTPYICFLCAGAGRCPSPALLAFAPPALVLAEARPPARLACACLALVLADAPPPALLGCAPLVLAEPHPHALLAFAPLALMLADAPKSCPRRSAPVYPPSGRRGLFLATSGRSPALDQSTPIPELCTPGKASCAGGRRVPFAACCCRPRPFRPLLQARFAAIKAREAMPLFRLRFGENTLRQWSTLLYENPCSKQLYC
jgi:hypothetical protein